MRVSAILIAAIVIAIIHGVAVRITTAVCHVCRRSHIIIRVKQYDSLAVLRFGIQVEYSF